MNVENETRQNLTEMVAIGDAHVTYITDKDGEKLPSYMIAIRKEQDIIGIGGFKWKEVCVYGVSDNIRVSESIADKFFKSNTPSLNRVRYEPGEGNPFLSIQRYSINTVRNPVVLSEQIEQKLARQTEKDTVSYQKALKEYEINQRELEQVLAQYANELRKNPKNHFRKVRQQHR